MSITFLTRWTRARTVFVETMIRAPMEDVWTHTQTPALHARWDLRFSSITPEIGQDAPAAPSDPSPDHDRPKRFRYVTRLAMGRAIRGWGSWTTTADRGDGSRVSTLHFGSDDPLSLIRSGSGYWRYVPVADGVRFLTAYDYETRLGMAGRIIDRLLFRPAIGWATAWSFDRLRRWLEDGIEPERALRSAVIHGVARGGLAGIMAWHGLVPKLLLRHPDERLLVRATGVPAVAANPAVLALGVAEVALAGWLLARWHDERPAAVAALIAIGGTVVVGITAPRSLGGAFGPVSLAVGTASLALIDRLTVADLPSAGRCRRRPAEGGP